MRPNPDRLSGSDSDASTDASDDNFEKIGDGKVCQDILSYMRHKKSHLLSNNECSQCDIIISGKNNLNCHKLEIHEADKDLPL